MEEKILIRKNIIIEDGLKTEKDKELIIPFSNMNIEQGKNQDPKQGEVTVMTKQAIEEHMATDPKFAYSFLDISNLKADQTIEAVDGSLTQDLNGDRIKT